MENQNTPTRQPGNLPVTRKMLDDAQYSTDIFDLPAVQDNWLRTYQKTTGMTDGAQRIEAEKVMLLQLIKGSSQLQEASKESLYSVFVELALSGLTLRDGLAYVIPYGKKATFQIGWKGRLEQITRMQNVIHVQEPQVVYDCDQFEWERGMEVKIHKHVQKYPRPEGSQIHFVYLVIHFTYGVKCYVMDRDEVLAIRDNFSDSYKQYLVDLPNVVNGKITKQGRNGTYTKDFEPPMWVSNEAQAFRKTLVKRVYNNMDKLPAQKALDEYQASNNTPLIDPDEITNQYDYTASLKIEDDTTYTEAEEVTNDGGVTQGVQQDSTAQNAQPAQQQAQPAANAAQPAQQSHPVQDPPKAGGRAQVKPTVNQPVQQVQPTAQDLQEQAAHLEDINMAGAPDSNVQTGMFDDIGDPGESF